MTEAIFRTFWSNVLNSIRISSKVEGQINYVEIVRDVITVFSSKLIDLPTSEGARIRTNLHSIPAQFSLFKNSQIPTIAEVESHYGKSSRKRRVSSLYFTHLG